jgi:hypothetical protein
MYTPTTPLDVDQPLAIDADAARLQSDWCSLGAQAMSRFAAEFPDEEPSAAVLWPTHFDLGITAGPADYGAAPGDDNCADPYLYVGPRDGPPGERAFWNAPFGSSAPSKQISTVPEAVAFFRNARARVHAALTSPSGRTS